MKKIIPLSGAVVDVIDFEKSNTSIDVKEEDAAYSWDDIRADYLSITRDINYLKKVIVKLEKTYKNKLAFSTRLREMLEGIIVSLNSLIKDFERDFNSFLKKGKNGVIPDSDDEVFEFLEEGNILQEYNLRIAELSNISIMEMIPKLETDKRLKKEYKEHLNITKKVLANEK